MITSLRTTLWHLCVCWLIARGGLSTLYSFMKHGHDWCVCLPVRGCVWRHTVPSHLECRRTRKQWRSLQHDSRSKPNRVDLGILLSRFEISWWRVSAVTSCRKSSWTSINRHSRKHLRWLTNLRPWRQRQDVCPPHQPTQNSNLQQFGVSCCVTLQEQQGGQQKARQIPAFGLEGHCESRGLSGAMGGGGGGGRSVAWPTQPRAWFWSILLMYGTHVLKDLLTMTPSFDPTIRRRPAVAFLSSSWQRSPALMAVCLMERIWTWNWILAQWCHINHGTDLQADWVLTFQWKHRLKKLYTF